MKPAAGQPGACDTAPSKNGNRGKAGRRARTARRLAERIAQTTDERQANWAEGDQPVRTERLTDDLDHLHADKRQMRRDLYREAPQLEGRPVNRRPSKRLGA